MPPFASSSLLARPRRTPRPPAVGAVGLITVVVLVVTGCTGPEPATSDATSPTAAALAPYYEQRPVWSSCGEVAECAEVQVPLDYDRPDGERIALAVKRLPAAGDDPDDAAASAGSLLVNFGGPGASGVQLVDALPQQLGDSPLLRAFDVVGFDPRGVGQSAAVDCVDDAGMDELRADQVDRLTEEGFAELTAAAADFAQDCARLTGRLLGEVDTVSAARDLDVLRAVLGDMHLNFLGYSYGTFLGATYAELFPERTGRLVLDGALDPSLSYAERTAGQAAGFERAVRAFAEDCVSRVDCPLDGDVDDAVTQVRTLLNRTATAPLPTVDGRALTQPLAATGILVGLYDHQAWPVLRAALGRALTAGDGSDLLLLADFVAGRQPDGTYVGNMAEAQAAVTCLDYPMDSTRQEMAAAAEELVRISPTFGDVLGYEEVRCQVWAHEATGSPGPITARGAAPILVVGTTGDPATPYAWSQALAEQLESGRLLTWQGEGHTAYGRSNECIRDAVDAYLIEGTLPRRGHRC